MADGNDVMRDNWETKSGAKWVRMSDEMDRRLAPVARLLLERAEPRPGERVLDVGCGGGATTLLLAEKVAPGGSVLGVDISDAMLDVARARVAEAGNFELIRADAEEHVFAPPRFDLVASRFGVMFFADPARAFRNIRGAMRAGGRLCFVCWAPLADNPHWRAPLEIAIRHLGPPAPVPPHAPGPMAFDDPDYVRALLERAGFHDIAITPEAITLPGRATPADEAEFATSMGPAGSRIGEATPPDDVLAAIRGEIAAAFAPYANAHGLALPATVFVVTATAPGHG